MQNWKPVKGYESLYEINELFEVKSLHNHTKGLIMSNFISDGYATVILSKNGVAKHHAVHRLAAEAFIPNPENKPFAIFLDGDRKNLSLENLQWATAKERSKYSISSKWWKELIPKIRKSYSPNLVLELNTEFHLIPSQSTLYA